MWKYVAGAIAFVASVFGILQFFGISSEGEKPNIQQQVSVPAPGVAMTENSAPTHETNIISNNQSAGITAHTVNVGTINMAPQPRILNDQFAQQLLAIPQGRLITVSAIMGDQEAFQFATQVKNFLESRGYNVSGVGQGIPAQPIVGQYIKPKGDGFEIVIGGRG